MEGMERKTDNRHEDVVEPSHSRKTAGAGGRGLRQAVRDLERIVKVFLTVAAAVFLLWVLVSLIDVDMHNDPFKDDGDPHGWNAFVIMTDGWR